MNSSFFGRLNAVDHVAAVAKQAVAVDVLRARLGVLASDTSHLYDRGGCAVGQHNGHLQQGLHIGANVRLSIGLKGLRTITALQQEGLTISDVGKLLTKLTNLRRDHNWRHRFENATHVSSGAGIPAWLL